MFLFCPFWLIHQLMVVLHVWQLPLLQAGSWHTGYSRAKRTPSWTTQPSLQWCSAIHPSGRWASQKVSCSSHNRLSDFERTFCLYPCHTHDLCDRFLMLRALWVRITREVRWYALDVVGHHGTFSTIFLYHLLEHGKYSSGILNIWVVWVFGMQG